jgi:hypothetical protein
MNNKHTVEKGDMSLYSQGYFFSIVNEKFLTFADLADRTSQGACILQACKPLLATPKMVKANIDILNFY